MSDSYVEIHLLVETPRPAGGAGGAARCGGFAALALPGGPCALRGTATGGQPGVPPLTVEPLAGPHSPVRPLVLEPVEHAQHSPRLLVLCATSGALRVNGQPAPRVILLKERDFVEWGAGAAFHVSIFRRAAIRPLPAEFIGRECPLCRVRFAAEDRVYSCACGAGLHCGDQPATSQCARLTRHCPACGRSVELASGYSYWPPDP